MKFETQLASKRGAPGLGRVAGCSRSSNEQPGRRGRVSACSQPISLYAVIMFKYFTARRE